MSDHSSASYLLNMCRTSRWRLIAGVGLAGAAFSRARRGGAGARQPGERRGQEGWRKRINSHEAFLHDSIDSLGYDWGRIADPSVRPGFPLKIYLPRTTDDIVAAVAEAKALGQPLAIRAKGHSSNDLVVSEGGSILLTEKLNSILEIDDRAMTVTVQPGLASADVDDVLAQRGLGLPVIGDHAHVTVGGFCSVGGITASSFRYGLFVDVVERIEYVDWDGNVIVCSRTERPDDFYKVLLGLGRHGVIAAVTVRIVRIEQDSTIWRNQRTLYRSLDAWLDASRRYLAQPPPDARFMRGAWTDLGRVGLGQFSAYRDCEQTTTARWRNEVVYGFLHGLGYTAGRLPTSIDRALKYVGLAGVLFSPRYATIKNAESFSDKILDAGVGDPTRYLVAIARMSAYEAVCRRLLALLRAYRERHGCFSAITLYVKGITSAYLSRGDADDQQWVEVLFYVAIRPERMSPELLDRLTAEFDDICIATDSYRYMHSKTSKDSRRRASIDPNEFYSSRAAAPATDVRHAT